MELSLKGRTALVTGGSLGLGRAMAESFSAAGADVAILARGEEALNAARIDISAHTGGRIEAYVADVSRAADLERALDGVEADLGGVDVLVNNAGKAQAGRFEDVTDEIWQADLDLKLFAAIRLCRRVLPGMKERRWGRVINLLNTAAKAPPANSAPTSVTRAAGMALTKVLAKECAPFNVLVNALLIGRIESDQIRRIHERSGTQQPYDEFVAEVGRQLPMGRMGEAGECAALALFLASDAGSYVTGCAINMDGGLSDVV